MPSTSSGALLTAKFLLLILGVHAVAVLNLVQPAVDSARLGDWRTQEVVVCVLSALLSISIWIRRDGGQSHLFFAIQVFFWAILEYSEGQNILFGCLASMILLLEALVFQHYPPWAVKLLQVGLLLPLAFHPIPVWGKPTPNLPWLDLAVLAAFMLILEYGINRTNKNSETLRELRAANENLNDSIAHLLAVNLDYQNYAESIGEKSTISERKRLTREIHDIVGYSLINLRMMLEACLDLSTEENKGLRDLLARAKDQVQTAMKDARQTLRNLRDIEAERLGCVQRTQKLVQSFSAATKIRVEVSYGNLPWSLGDEIDSALFRIIQESMTNSFRHGKADLVQIRFSISQGKLFLNVSDNGQSASPMNVGIGISGMKERLEPLHGTLRTENYDYGFILHVEIPLEMA